MDLTQWVLNLEPSEAAYVRQCFKFWNGTNGGIEPPLPPGISQSRADILRYHCQSLNNGSRGKRNMEKKPPVNFRCPESLHRQLAFEAAQLDISLSEYILRCLNVGRPIVRAFPKLSNQFKEPVIELSYTSRN